MSRFTKDPRSNATRSQSHGSRHTSKPIRQRQDFTNQRTGQRYETLHQLENTLCMLGGSPTGGLDLLKSYFSSKMGKYYYQGIIQQEENKSLSRVMKNIQALRSNASNIDKNVILSCVAPEFSRNTLNQRFGLGVGEDSFTKARKIARSKGIGAFFKRKGTTKQLSDVAIQSIKDFYYLDDVSREAANRTVKVGPKGRKTSIPVRYLQDTKRNTFLKYTEHCRKETIKGPSFSSFQKYKPKEIKKAKRDSDLCPICSEGKRIRPIINRLQKVQVPSEEQTAELNDLLEKIALIDRHIELERTLRAEFNRQKAELQVGDAIIVMDFKENMKLGKAQQETARNFYDTPNRSIFTIAVYKRIGKSNDIKKDIQIQYFTFISECLTHDSTFVLDCMNTLFESQDWINLNVGTKSVINLWMDNAPQHFRTFEFINGFYEFSKGIFSTNKFMLNYFGEYHGKCVCDSHFSLLSRYYRDYSMSDTFKDPVYTTQDFISLLKYAVNQSNLSTAWLNEHRKSTTSPYPLLQVQFFEYKRTHEESKLHQLIAPNFTSFYHFFVRNTPSENVLIAKQHPKYNKEHVYQIKTKKTKLPTPKKIKLGWSDSQRTLEFNVGSLARKESFLNQSTTGPPKRKRGRPRNTVSSQPTKKRSSPKPTTKSNKKKGRPRKTALSYELDDDISELLTFDLRMDDERLTYYSRLIANHTPVSRTDHDTVDIDSLISVIPPIHNPPN